MNENKRGYDIMNVQIIDNIISIIGIILMILINVNLWLRYYEKNGGSKTIEILVCTVFIIVLSLELWGYESKYFLFILLLFTFSYVNLCIVYKKNFGRTQYNITFVLLTLFFVIWITVLFGKFYYDNNLIDVSIYDDRVNEIFTKYKWFPIYDFHLSLIFFDIGIKKYFIEPENIMLNDIHFVQFISGIIISGTIISGIFEFIKNIIFPKNE